MKLGLMFACPPDAPDWAAMISLADKARAAGEEVYLYLIDDGVLCLNSPEIHSLRQTGIRLFACAYGAQKRGMPWNSEEATFCGLTTLLDILCGCDRFFAFTPLETSPEGRCRRQPGVLPRTLVIVREDPRLSHRPAEAIRIAAGIGGWGRTEVDLLLRGPGLGVLSKDADGLMDGENFRLYLPLVLERRHPIHLAFKARNVNVLTEAAPLCRQCNAAQIASLASHASWIIPF